MSERQKDLIVKLVRELLKETPARVSVVEKLRAVVEEADAKEAHRRARRRKKYRAYLKEYGVEEGRKLWRQHRYNIAFRPRGLRRRRLRRRK